MPTQAMTSPPAPDAGTRSATPDEDEVLTCLRRLSRPHPSGGHVIERAAILAEGAGSAAILTRIAACDGEPEFADAPAARGGGLHGERHGAASGPGRALRYVLPPGALGGH